MDTEIDMNLTAAPDEARALSRALPSDFELVCLKQADAFAIRWKQERKSEGSIDQAIKQFLQAISPALAQVDVKDKFLRVGAFVEIATISIMIAELETDTVCWLAEIETGVQITFYPCSD